MVDAVGEWENDRNPLMRIIFLKVNYALVIVVWMKVEGIIFGKIN